MKKVATKSEKEGRDKDAPIAAAAQEGDSECGRGGGNVIDGATTNKTNDALKSEDEPGSSLPNRRRAMDKVKQEEVQAFMIAKKKEVEKREADAKKKREEEQRRRLEVHKKVAQAEKEKARERRLLQEEQPPYPKPASGFRADWVGALGGASPAGAPTSLYTTGLYTPKQGLAPEALSRSFDANERHAATEDFAPEAQHAGPKARAGSRGKAQGSRGRPPMPERQPVPEMLAQQTLLERLAQRKEYALEQREKRQRIDYAMRRRRKEAAMDARRRR
eukprot:gene7125-8500_t